MSPEEIERKEAWIERQRCAREERNRLALADFLAKDEPPELRRKAARALAGPCEASVLERIVERFGTERDVAVKRELVAAFAASDAKERLDDLERELETAGDARYRARLLAALVTLGGKARIDGAVEAIDRAPPADRAGFAVEIFDAVRGNAYKALLLERLAGHADRDLLDRFVERVWEGRDAFAGGFLETVASSGEDAAAWRASGALAARGASAHLERLVAGLSSIGDAGLRSLVAAHMGRVGGAVAIDALLARARRETDPGALAACLEAAGRPRDERAFKALKGWASDRRPEVAAAAQRAIRAIAERPDNRKARKFAERSR